MSDFKKQITLGLMAAALLMLPTSANATQWFYNRVPIAEGTTVTAETESKNLTLVLTRPKQTTVKIVCPAKGVEAFWNSQTNGMDETKEINFVCPAGTTVTPVLIWPSMLLESALPLHDRWENMALDLVYEGTDLGTFTGSLDTTIGDVDPQRDREHFANDEPDSFLTFRGGSNRPLLTGPNGAKVWFSGGMHWGTNGARVTDSDGGWATS